MDAFLLDLTELSKAGILLLHVAEGSRAIHEAKSRNLISIWTTADFKGKVKAERKLQWAATQCFFLTIFLGKTF